MDFFIGDWILNGLFVMDEKKGGEVIEVIDVFEIFIEI